MTKVYILVYHDQYGMPDECEFGGCELPTEIMAVSIDNRAKCEKKLSELICIGYCSKDLEILEKESL